ncbi:PAS domain S-box protein [Verrucomicrobium sp. BvORR034]|uniref:hybrid sensor histidine kinase/response regulator n=1 Tax=Verrucomicrobium sp. BvORR034 TaxID=1396418 RepID=UPI0009DCD548|nr:PAS domain S-box protein [Verrucomicrobium sp. BvORR034]
MTSLPTISPQVSAFQWPEAGGEMARRMAEFDWAEHPLGPPEGWPQSLRTTVSILLTSRYDMWLGWGPELYFFCNDAYLPTLGLKKDWVLGRPASEVWAEVWDDAGPRSESVLQTGRATWDECLLLFLERNGYPEETYHTFSYSPVPDDGGGVGGMLCVVTEETERVIGERRLAVLQDLAESLAVASCSEALMEEVGGCLQRHRVDLPFSLVYLFDNHDHGASGQAVLRSQTGVHQGGELAPAVLSCGTDDDSGAGPWPVARILAEGEPVEVSLEHLQDLPTGPYSTPRAAVMLPLFPHGQEEPPTGFLVAGVNPCRPLDGPYRGFLELVAGQISAGLATAGAFEMERERAESLLELDRVRRESATQLRESEERTRLAVEAGKVGVWDWNLAAGTVGWSELTHRIFGVEPGGFDGTFEGFLGHVHPVDRVRVAAEVNRAHAGDGRFNGELRALTPSGEVRWIECHGQTAFSPQGEPERMHGTVLDITERKRAEELLRETRLRLETTLFAAEIGTWNWDIRNDQVTADENMARLFFVDERDKDGPPVERFMEMIHRDDVARVRRAMDVAISDPTGNFEQDYRVVSPKGQVRWVTARGRVQRDSTGKPERFPGVIIDITGRKQAEEDLEGSEQRHRKLLSLLPIACYTLNEDGWLTFYNDAARELWGRAPDLSRVRWCGSYRMWSLDGQFIPHDQSPMVAALREARPARGAEVVVERPDGTRRWVALSSDPLHDARGRCRGLINVALDVSDERRTQKALAQSEAFLQSVISSTADCIMVMDPQGGLQWTSANGIRMLEMDEASLPAGRSWLDMWQDETSQRVAQAALRQANAGQVGRFRGFCPTFAGTPKWWDVMVTPIPARDGGAARFLSVARDVTERTNAEHALSRLAAIVESSDDAIISKDLAGRILSWNKGAERLFGYQAREIVGRPIMTLIPDDRFNEEHVILDKLRAGSRLEHYETVRRRKDGTHVDVSLTVSPIRNEQGVIVGASKIARDITQKKLDEAELRRSERLYRAIGESMNFGIWICDAAGRNQYASDSLLKLVGMTQAEFAGDGWMKALHPEDVQTVRLAWRRCVAGPDTTFWESEQRFRGLDGAWHPVLARGVPVRDEAGRLQQWVGINLDISELKKTEEALRRSEAHLTAVFQQAGSGIAQTDLEGRYVMVNDAYCEITGRTREELLGQQVHEITHPDDRLHYVDAHGALAGEGPAFIMENRFVRADGVEVWVRNSVVGLRDSQERLSGTLSITQDITESRHAEDALMASEQQLRLVTDHAPVYLAQVDRHQCYKFANRPYAAQYELEVPQLLGRPMREVMGEAAYEAARGCIEAALAGELVEFEMQIHSPSTHDELGSRWIHAVFMPEWLPDQGDVTGFVLVQTDVTNRKQSELDLEQARDQALEAVRAKDDFLARLSHELRTPLSPVLLLASEGASNPEVPESVQADFDTIRKNVDLEARLIDDLLDLTRITRGKLAMDLQNVDVHLVLRDALDTVRQDAEEKSLVLTLALHATSRLVWGDKVRLQQVFWNLLKNAVKFTPEYGAIVVSTALGPEPGMVMIRVSDNGMGMTLEEQQRVFEAFAQGEHAMQGGSHRYGGLGLGLTITRMLVELHEGRIQAMSEGRGHGTTFVITLPLVKAAASADGENNGGDEGEVAAAKQTGGPISPAVWRRILLVEDHDATRAALGVLLRRRGYEVSAACSVEEARLLGNEGAFDLVISDIGLPDGSGYEVMRHLKSLQPELRGIALSGYGMEQDVAHSHESGFSLHLTKPVRVEALDQAIETVFRQD